MRLWSLHPKYLDPQGLVALWREALLAQAVLRDETRGYRQHPQLARFREHPAPLGAISRYLGEVLREAVSRGYVFDPTRIKPVPEPDRQEPIALSVTSGQLAYEWAHLMTKLQTRNPEFYRRWRDTEAPDPHPLFRVQAGDVEGWERR